MKGNLAQIFVVPNVLHCGNIFSSAIEAIVARLTTRLGLDSDLLTIL